MNCHRSSAFRIELRPGFWIQLIYIRTIVRKSAMMSMRLFESNLYSSDSDLAERVAARCNAMVLPTSVPCVIKGLTTLKA